MRAAFAASVVLALLTFLPGPASAQVQGSLVMQLAPPEEALTQEGQQTTASRPSRWT